jgi:Ca2+-binding EF-hand superfamily protein
MYSIGEKNIIDFQSLLSSAFKLYDLDSDGYITRVELLDIVDAIYRMVVCIFLALILRLNEH